MFDIGFLELLICGVIALLVLGPERLPTAARAAGRWIGGARRMVNQFTSELDRQLKAEELREQLRKAGGDVGLEEVRKTVHGALDEAKKYEHMILEDAPDRTRLAPSHPDATELPAIHGQDTGNDHPEQAPDSDRPAAHDSSEKTS